MEAFLFALVYTIEWIIITDTCETIMFCCYVEYDPTICLGIFDSISHCVFVFYFSSTCTSIKINIKTILFYFPGFNTALCGDCGCLTCTCNWLFASGVSFVCASIYFRSFFFSL